MISFGKPLPKEQVRQMLIEGWMIYRHLLDYDEDNPCPLTIEQIAEQGLYREEAERKYKDWGKE